MEVVVIGFTGSELARNKEGHTAIRTIWYFFWLAFTATCITIFFASRIGAINNQGIFQGKMGANLNWLLSVMLNLNFDIYASLAILLIILIPQFGSYLFSGIFGCASNPRYVSKSIFFFTWGFSKSFVVVAGIILSLTLFGYFEKWNGWSVKVAVSMSGLSVGLLMLSFLTFYFYYEEKPFKDLFIKKFAVLHTWLTRKI